MLTLEIGLEINEMMVKRERKMPQIMEINVDLNFDIGDCLILLFVVIFVWTVSVD